MAITKKCNGISSGKINNIFSMKRNDNKNLFIFLIDMDFGLKYPEKSYLLLSNWKVFVQNCKTKLPPLIKDKAALKNIKEIEMQSEGKFKFIDLL